MTPFAFGLVRALAWALALLFGFLAARARPGRVRGGLLVAGLAAALLARPPLLGFALLLSGFLLGLFPSARGPASG